MSATLIHLYKVHDQFLVPVVAETTAGYFLDVDPVERVPASDRDALVGVLDRELTRGNPVVPSPSRDNFPAPVVLKPAAVRSWKALERIATIVSISSDRAKACEVSIFRPRAGRRSGADEETHVLPGSASASEIAGLVLEQIELR